MTAGGLRVIRRRVGFDTRAQGMVRNALLDPQSLLLTIPAAVCCTPFRSRLVHSLAKTNHDKTKSLIAFRADYDSFAAFR